MRVFGLLCVLASLAAGGPLQETKPARTAAKTVKSADNKKSAKKPAASTTASSPAKPKGQPKKADSKINNPIAPNPVSKQPKAKSASEKPAIDDTAADAAYDKIGEIVDGSERVAALRKFIKTFSKSKRVADARASLVTVQTQLGNDKIAAADVPGAVEHFKKAVADAPVPIPDQLFNETLARVPINLYFRGARAEGFEVAKAIERKSAVSVPQLLAIATFYLNVENGSEARRVVEAALKTDPASGAAYQMLGLANRMDFQLDESAQAYAKALELEPDSVAAKRGLSEMKRALGKPDEAVTLYKEILAKDEADMPSRTGLVLAMYDAGMKSEADAELAKALEQNPGNVILLAGASYWMAANGQAERSVELAQKAISTDPRFIWSHIALARGYTANGNPVAAEKTLIAARRYGNFPTLEFEIARCRVAAGFFREAADELAKSFTVKNGEVQTNLGGRITRSSKDLNELVGNERRASIFAPTSADGPELSTQMIALLELRQELEKTSPDVDKVAKAADEFAAGDDKMKVHRIVYAGHQLLEKKIAAEKVVELAKSAPAHLDLGLDAPEPVAAVLASELYETRVLAAAKNEFVNIPAVPRFTLSAVLRGRVEEMSGWAYMQLENASQATVHLRRAVSVLPADSAWWRSSTWRLGTALVSDGKLAEALEIYIRNYKSGQPDSMRYSVIEALYRQVNGNTVGLDDRIGRDPSAAASSVASAFPRPKPSVPASLVKSEATSDAAAFDDRPRAELPTASAPSPTPDPKPAAIPVTPPAAGEPTPKASEAPEVRPEPLIESTPEASPSPTPESTPAATPTESAPSPTPSPEDARPETSPTPVRTDIRTATEPSATAVAKETASTRLTDNSNGMFPPVVIMIPPPPKVVTRKEPESTVLKSTPTAEESIEAKTGDPATTSPATSAPGYGRPRLAGGTTEPAVKPCSLTLDQDSITVQTGGNERAIVVRRTDDGDIEGITAATTSGEDISVRREPLPGVKWTALFVLKSLSSKPGLFQVVFEAPCGRKEVPVRVQ